MERDTTVVGREDAQQRAEKKIATRVAENEKVRGPVTALATPIFASSTYLLDSAAHGARLASVEGPLDGESPWLYSRWGNPTTDVAARTINKLENGHTSFVTSSGMAAISTALFAHLQAGDHVVAPEPVYGGTHEVFKSVLPSYGIEVSWVDGTSVEAYREAIKDNTKVIYAETPANPTMCLCDLQGLGDLSKQFGVISMVDSTFASPCVQTPLDFGVNIVIHSATKYLGGHSDLVAGCISVDNASSAAKVFQTLKLFGGCPSAYDAFLLIRGMKTLDVRMARHNANAMAIAAHLQQHDQVLQVHYPGLEGHPQHELAKRQMKHGFGGMIAFEVKGGVQAGVTVLENLKLINLAVSLGGVESLIEHAASMTHCMVPRKQRLQSGITDGLLRLSVGLEDVRDLIADLDQALTFLDSGV